MNRLQKTVEKFIKARRWDEDHLYDVLLNLHEEIDEVWNIIKHLGKDRDKEMLKKVIRQSKEELDDGIGDPLYLILKLAVMLNIDAEKAVQNRLREFEKRFPAKKLRGFHGNLRASGIDYKYQRK